MKINPIIWSLMFTFVIMLAACGGDQSNKNASEEEQNTEKQEVIIPEVNKLKAYKVKAKKKSVGDEVTNPCVPDSTCFCIEYVDTTGVYINADLDLDNTSNNQITATVTFYYRQNNRWVPQMSSPFSTPVAAHSSQEYNTGDILLYRSDVSPDSILMVTQPPLEITRTMLTPCN